MTKNKYPVPVLYSFRRCPYCMRAYMALKYAGIKVELREVDLNDLPPQVLMISSEATVPVLVLPDATVFTESWGILKWVLEQNDPDNWFGENKKHLLDAEILIESNDFSFKNNFDHYKYADRFPECTEVYYRELYEEFIEELEDMLCENKYLLTNHLTLADIGVFPFVRQFSLVDKEWFDQSSYPNARRWLEGLIDSEFFQQGFQKHDLWKEGCQ